jgi:hypothetical protein
MTHVWQGHNQSFAWSYVGNSIACQCAVGKTAAYKYTPGNQWTTYQAEPQAQIVEHWYQHLISPGSYPLPPNGVTLAPQFQGFAPQFQGLSSQSDPIAVGIYQAYINCNIRPGQPYAHTSFPQSPLTMHNSAALRKALLTPATFGVKPISSPMATNMNSSAALRTGLLGTPTMSGLKPVSSPVAAITQSRISLIGAHLLRK